MPIREIEDKRARNSCGLCARSVFTGSLPGLIIFSIDRVLIDSRSSNRIGAAAVRDDAIEASNCLR
jgi:hypothetical protein